jgi:hypothetical protein
MNGVGGPCNTRVTEMNTVSVEELQGRRPLTKCNSRWNDNKLNLKLIGLNCFRAVSEGGLP